MFLFVIKKYVYYSPGGKFFTPVFGKITSKIGIIPAFSNTLPETLRTFLVVIFIVGEIKSIMIKFWKIKSCNAILGVPPRDSCCR